MTILARVLFALLVTLVACGPAAAPQPAKPPVVGHVLGYVPTSAITALSSVGHRCTLTTSTPITTADVTGATTIYLTPLTSTQIGLYTSGAWRPYLVPQISIALGTLTSAKPYDVFVYDNAGTVSLAFSAAWGSDTSRTDALATQDGVPVLSSNHAKRHMCTFYTTSTTQTEDSVLNRYVWNRYNQQPRPMRETESGTSWTYSTTNTWRAANNNSANSFNYVTGDAGARVQARVDGTSGGSIGACIYGVGVDSTSASSATIAPYQDGLVSNAMPLSAPYEGFPGLGKHTLTWLEWTGSGGCKSYGTTGGIVAGMSGTVWQ